MQLLGTMDKLNPAGVILILIGLFSFTDGLFNWQWFMNTRRASGLVWSIGLKGTRFFYMLLGVAFLFLGFK